MRKAALPLMALVFAFAGCVQPPPAPVADIVPVPTVEPESIAAPQPTVLERLQDVSRQLDAEKQRADQLAARLAEQKAARDKAEAEVEQLRQRVASLEQRTRQFDEMRAKLDEAQKSALDMENTVRDLRRDLLEERLAGARREQTLLSLKIEKAVERRKQALEHLPDAGAQAFGMEKKNEVAKP